MKTCVFLGPSLPAREAAAFLADATIRPPVRAGDVRAAVEDGFACIGIIDGLFEQVATVWHKEILFALSRGVWVYAGGSMGALRAAELAPYGVIGVGSIYELFRSGELEDDDEVAVVHTTEEEGFREMSTAMVNIRFALRRAHALGLISSATQETLLSLAKGKFYADRSWKALFFDGSRIDYIPPAELSAIEDWVKAERPSQKREDAIAVLKRIAADAAAPRPAFRPSFSFERTTHWDDAERAFLERRNPQ